MSAHAKKKCTYNAYTPFQTFLMIMALLGVANLFAFGYMVLYFSGERLGFVQYLQVVYIDTLTDGENWILFISYNIIIFFVIILLLWVIYRIYVKRKCTPVRSGSL